MCLTLRESAGSQYSSLQYMIFAVAVRLSFSRCRLPPKRLIHDPPLTDKSVCRRPALPALDLCCQTGCPKCVFAVFAEELIAYCSVTGRDPMAEVRDITSDPNMRAMIQMLVNEAKVKSQQQ